MLKQTSTRVNAIKPSATLAISAKAKKLKSEGEDIINLSVGEPDFDTPDHIKNAAINAIHKGETKYTAVDGTQQLKEAIAYKFSRDNNLNFKNEEIIASNGAKHSIFNLFSAVLNPGNEIIIPSPFWVSYPDIAKLVGAIPTIIKTKHTNQFKITPAELRAAITPSTRLIMLNSPSNPTGMAYSETELQELGKVITEHPNILIATDDIYEQTLWNGSFSNILMANPHLHEQVVIINGVSKSYAMTGWRIGYAAGPNWLINAMKKIQSQSTSNPCSIAQAAATAALKSAQECAYQMRDEYRKRHDFVIQQLAEIPNTIVHPSHGTFYTFPNVAGWLNKEKSINNDIKLAEYLLTEAKVAIVPGTAFGAPNCIRISYATNIEILEIAVDRIKTAINKLNN